MEGELIENNGLDIYDTSETPKKRGRPAKYNEKIATQIVLLVSEGYSAQDQHDARDAEPPSDDALATGAYGLQGRDSLDVVAMVR